MLVRQLGIIPADALDAATRTAKGQNHMNRLIAMCAHCGWVYRGDDARTQAQMCASSHPIKSYRYASDLPAGAWLAIGDAGAEKMQ
jgi:hypothetical protein